LIRLLADVAIARDRCGRQALFFVFHRVEERLRVRFAHLARLDLRIGSLRGSVLVRVRAGLGLGVTLRLTIGRLGLLPVLIGLLLLVWF
jgi:hypothetical protein